MTTRALSVSNRNYSAQVTNEATDLGVGAPITPVVLAGIAGGLLGYTNPLAGYNSFRMGSRILAEDTGRVWIVGRDSANARVLVLETQGSGNILSPLRGLLFVDAAAVAGGNGSIAQPYNTLQDALNAALPNTTIQMTAGTYVQDVVMPNKDFIEIIGAGRGQTVLRNATDSSTFSWIRTGAGLPTITRFSMQDLTIECDAATATNGAVYMDSTNEIPNGPGVEGTFATDGIYFTRVNVLRTVVTGLPGVGGRAAYFRRVGKVEWLNCVWVGAVSVPGTVVTQNLGRGTAYGTQFTNLDIEYIRSNPAPANGRNGFTLLAGSGVAAFENLTALNHGGTTLRGHPILLGDATSLLSGSTGVPALQGVGLTTTNGSGGFGPQSAPIIQFSGTIGVGPSTAGSGQVTLPLPAFPAGFQPPTVDFSFAKFVAVPAVAGSLRITAASGSILVPQLVRATQASLTFLSGAGIAVPNAIEIGSATVGINHPVVFDARQAFGYSQSMFNVAAGSFLDRTSWTIAMAAFTVAPIVQPILPQYPPLSTYSVSYQSSLPVAIGVTSPTTSTVTITAASAVPAGGSITLTRT